MKNIYISGSVIKYTCSINEGLFDFDGNNHKDTFLGRMLSFIPGMGGDEKKEQKDEYQKAVNDWTKKWIDEKKKDLEAAAQHKIAVKTQNYINQQELKMTHLEKERKEKDIARKVELAEMKKVQKQLKEQQTKIKAWTGGPGTEEYLNNMVKIADKIYEDATPAEQQVKDNVMGMVVDCMHDDDGNFITDPEQRKTRFNARYGEKWLKENPELKKAWEAYEAKSTDIKTYEDFVNQVVNPVTQGEDFKTNDEIQTEIDELEEYAHEKARLEKKVEDLKEERKTRDENIEKLQKIQDAGEVAKKDKTTMQEKTATTIKQEMVEEAMKVGNDGLVVKPDGADEPTINKESPAYKHLKQLGLEDSDMEQLLTIDDNNRKTKLEEIVNNKVTDEKVEEYKDGVIKEYDKAIARAEETKDSYDRQIADKDKDGQDGDPLAKAENDLDEYVKNGKSLQTKVRKALGKPDDGTPITDKDMAQASAKYEEMMKENVKAGERAKETMNKVRKAHTQMDNEKKLEDFEKTLNAEQQKEFEEKSKPDIDQPNENGEFVYKDKKTGEEIKIRKPTDEKAPDYDKQMKDYSTKVAASIAMKPLGEKPTLGPNEDPTVEKLAEIRKWEANKKSREAARLQFVENCKKEGITEDEARSILADHDWAGVENISDSDDFIDAEDDNEENADYKDEEDESITPEEEEEIKKEEDNAKKKLKELEQKKSAGEPVSDEELENARKAVEATQSKKPLKNPMKIWHKKKKENGNGTTKNYYDKNGDHISPQKYQDLVDKFKERVKARRTKGTQENQSLTDNHPLIYEKRSFTFNPINKRGAVQYVPQTMPMESMAANNKPFSFTPISKIKPTK